MLALLGPLASPIERLHPEHAPAYGAEDRNQIGQALSSPKPGLFSSAA